jgi:hypothetical protein
MEPWAHADSDSGSPLAWMCAAIGAQFADVDAIVRTDDNGVPGWARLFNPATAPEARLEWLAQWIPGVPSIDGLPGDEQRLLLVPNANQAGTPASIVAAVRPLLTGTQTVRLVERTTSAYRHTVVVATSETPDADAIRAKLRDPRVKPTGHWFSLVVTDGPIWDEQTGTWDDVDDDVLWDDEPTGDGGLFGFGFLFSNDDD